jgi:hypothetical protein
MGNKYIVSRDNITPTAAQDVMTFVTASARRARLVQIILSGMGATSAAQRIRAGRSTGGTTGGGALTPNKFEHTDQPTAVTVVNTTWSAQPTIDTHLAPLGWNAIGGALVWNPPGGKGIEARNAENISIRAEAGVTYQAMSIAAIFEED